MKQSSMTIRTWINHGSAVLTLAAAVWTPSIVWYVLLAQWGLVAGITIGFWLEYRES